MRVVIAVLLIQIFIAAETIAGELKTAAVIFQNEHLKSELMPYSIKKMSGGKLRAWVKRTVLDPIQIHGYDARYEYECGTYSSKLLYATSWDANGNYSEVRFSEKIPPNEMIFLLEKSDVDAEFICLATIIR
ncbi:hypothetical protein HZU75_12360 [Chitinibacter fontanus]|uniref:Uncharacterized protein n=1 Tax=Chitinibacter fontanus TaxID=1737446 RepID=A0A7D5VBK5_9NEIS|nr:hypothetical protein [Chitinibacter fontanus]QLI82253.1 hypothetical protein HZU75_12360 [Chitinibacter fontanus]